MSYFKHFPKALYSTDNFKTTDLTTNIVARFKFLDEVIQTVDAYYPVVIRDGERPDTIADKYYGDSKYTWIVLAFNQYIDPQFEWPLNDEEFQSFIKREYGDVATAMSTVKYYYKTLNGKKYIVDENQAYTSVDFVYDFERNLNENRRNIKLLDRLLIPKVEAAMAEIFK